MKMRKFLLAALVVCSNAMASTKTLELVVPYSPGGTADKFAQVILPALRTELAKENILPVVVYRPGAGSLTGIASVAKSDQLQLLITSNSVINAPILNKLPNSYNLAEDLEVVSYLGHLPMIIATNPSSGIRSFEDLRSQCKSKSVSYASGGTGTAGHLGSAIIFEKLGCNAVHVPYKGGAPMVTALLGNHVQLATDFVSGIKPLVDEGKLIPLLVLDRNRVDSFPAAPSLADVGIADYNFDFWFVIMSNRVGGAQQALVAKAVANAVNSQEVVLQLRTLGLKDIGSKKPKDFLVEKQKQLVRILKSVKLDD